MNKKKLLAIVGAIILIFVISFYFISKNKNSTNETKKTEEITKEKKEENKKEQEEQNKDYRALTDEEYKTLISGDYSKDELESILPYLHSKHINHKDENMVYILSVLENENKDFIKSSGYDTKLNGSKFSLKNINRLISLYTDKQYKDSDKKPGFYIDEKSDTFALALATIPLKSEGKIKETLYNEEKKDLKILYTVKSTFSSPDRGKDKKEGEVIAHLKLQENGKYRITRLEEVEKGSNLKDKISLEMKKTESIPKIKEAFKEVVMSFKEKNGKYGKIEGSESENKYFLMDLNEDNIKELIIVGSVPSGRFVTSAGKIFGYENDKIVEFKNDTYGQNIFYGNSFSISKNGKELFAMEFTPGTGMQVIYKITVDYKNSKTLQNEVKQFRINTKESEEFGTQVNKIELKSLDTEINMEN